MLFKRVFIFFSLIVFFQKLAASELNLSEKISNKKYISIVFASNNLRSVASIFGHTFLVFHNEELPELDSIALDFLAQSEEENFSQGKAFFYKVKANYRVRNYLDKKNEYDFEDRDLFIYTLNLKNSEKEDIVKVVLQSLNQDYYYNFNSFNCAFYIYKILSDANLTQKMSPFLYTLPINTIRTLEKNKLIASYRIDYSSQSLFKSAYDQLSSTEKALVEEYLRLRSSPENHLNTKMESALNYGVNYLALHENNIYKRDELLKLKRKFAKSNNNLPQLMNPLEKNGETSIALSINPINKSQSIEIKPGLRDFKTNYSDGLMSSYFEILKLKGSRKQYSFNLDSIVFIKVNNFVSEKIYNQSLNSYLELSWDKVVSPGYLLSFGLGQSMNISNFNFGIKPVIALKHNHSLNFLFGGLFNIQISLWGNNLLESEFNLLNSEAILKNNLSIEISSRYRFFVSHQKSKINELLDLGLVYLF